MNKAGYGDAAGLVIFTDAMPVDQALARRFRHRPSGQSAERERQHGRVVKDGHDEVGCEAEDKRLQRGEARGVQKGIEKCVHRSGWRGGRMNVVPATPCTLAPGTAEARFSVLMPNDNDANAGFKTSVDD